MKRSLILCLALSLALLSGCKEAQIIGGMVGATGVSVGSVPVSSYAESAVKGGAAVAKSMEDFTPEQEYYIGRAVAASLFVKYRPLENRAANEYVNLLGQGMALFSSQPQTYGGYHFQIVDSAEINAFAAPGGLVLITKGLIQCCPDENALAAVLAHEISHVQNKDALRSIKKSRVTEAVAIIGGEAVKHVAGAQLAQLTSIFADSIGDIMTSMVNNGYSRTYEFEADKSAVAIINSAGYDPAGLNVMLKTMEQRLGSGGTGFAKTHPSPADRMKELATLAKTSPSADSAARMARFKQALGNL